jgi:hypothetical protein
MNSNGVGENCIIRSFITFSYLRNIIRMIKLRRMRWAGPVASTGTKRNICRVLMGKPEGKRTLRKPRRRWEDNIKMELREIGWGCKDWVNLVRIGLL